MICTDCVKYNTSCPYGTDTKAMSCDKFSNQAVIQQPKQPKKVDLDLSHLPKPYYQDDAVTIYHADCRNILPLLPKVDLVLTDPPYGINFSAANYEKWNAKQGTASVRVTTKMQGDDGSLDLSFLANYPRRFVWGFPYLKDPEATGWFVWAKRQDNAPNPMGNPLEMGYTTCWSGFHWRFFLWVGYMIQGGEQRFNHPTQKPDAIMSYLVDKTSKQGEYILDPFIGSGSTAFAAKKLGRKCIGIEIEEKYCEIAAKRCSQSVMALDETPESDKHEGVPKYYDDPNEYWS